MSSRLQGVSYPLWPVVKLSERNRLSSVCSSRQIRSLFQAKCLYSSVKGSGITTIATVAAVAAALIAAPTAAPTAAPAAAPIAAPAAAPAAIPATPPT